MNRRTFMKFLLGTVASIAVNPIDALSRPAQPMPIPRQPIPEPEPVEPIIEVSNFGRSIEYDGEIFHSFDPGLKDRTAIVMCAKLKELHTSWIPYDQHHAFFN